MELQSGFRNVLLACILGLGIYASVLIDLRLGTIADRMETATIGGTRVPAVECAEDEVIAWTGEDTLGCVHYENVE